MLTNCRQSPRATSVGFFFQPTDTPEIAGVLFISNLTVQLENTVEDVLGVFLFWGGDPALTIIAAVVTGKHHGWPGAIHVVTRVADVAHSRDISYCIATTQYWALQMLPESGFELQCHLNNRFSS
jgi:hypothetical protein